MGDDIDLLEGLAATELFSGLSESDKHLLASQLRPMRLAPGEVLVRQGDEAHDAFVIVRGSLSAVVEDEEGGERRLAELGPGDIVGEVAFLAGGPRSATVRAAGDAYVARLSSEGFARLLAEQPVVAARLARHARRRLLRRHLAAALDHIFGGIDDDARAELEDHLEWVPLSAGEVLYEEGEAGETAFIVVFGRLRFRLPSGATGDLDRGEIAGAPALLEPGPRRETVFAARDSYLVRLGGGLLTTLARRRPEAVLAFARTALRQVTQARPRRPAQQPLTLAIIAAASGVDARAFAADLTRVLSGHGPALQLASDDVDGVLGRSGIAQSEPGEPAGTRLTTWLHELEESHSFLVYTTDPAWSAWSRRCVRQADRILLLADGSGAARGALDQRLPEILPARRRPHVTLVVVHRPETRLPAGTATSLAGTDVDEVAHVRRGSSADMDRLGRIVAGRCVALVLSGGGARGFGHLGAIRALLDAGVPIDVVGGTSIGAIIGTLWAKDVGYPELLRAVRSGFARLLDYTLPAVALLKARRITESMRRQYGDHDMEDLWLPSFCVSTSLARMQEVVHRRGSLVRLMRATSAVPGVMPPVPIEGELHVDGGVLNNLPVDVMRDLFPTASVVAVDAAPSVVPATGDDFGLWVSGLRALATRRGTKQPRPPALSETLLRATLASSNRHRERVATLADLYVRLDIRGVGLLEFDAVDAIAEKGYELAAPQVDGWAAKIAASRRSQ